MCAIFQRKIKSCTQQKINNPFHIGNSTLESAYVMILRLSFMVVIKNAFPPKTNS